MFTLPDLPYPYDALKPAISEKTLRLHHDKHHGAYVKTLNEVLEKLGKTPASLEEVIVESAKGPERRLYNHGAQAWNHAFFWVAMSPRRQQPTQDLAAAIEASSGGLAGLRDAFVKKGLAHFGSGWVWLTTDAAGALQVTTTHDAHDMLTEEGITPLTVCDIWEHAYYLDYQNGRKRYLEAWFDALPNWEFAASQLEAAKAGRAPWRHPAPMATARAA